MIKLNKKGETLLEALCALAIMTIVVSALATVITTTANANKKIAQKRITFNQENKSVVTESFSVNMYKSNSKVGTFSVQGYKDGELYYYE